MNDVKHATKTNGGVVATTAAVAAEQPKPAEVKAVKAEAKVKKTPIDNRLYTLVAMPSVPPKGKQRSTILQAIAKLDGKEFTAKDLIPFCKEANYNATAGIEASVKWHLHQMELLKIVAVSNLTITVEEQKAA